MSWIFLAVLAGLFSSLFNYVNRYVLRTNGDSTSFAWWFELLRTLIFILILPFDNFVSWSVKTIFLLLILGFVEFFSVYFYMKMHRFSQLSISTIILRLRIVWVPILAFLLIGEKLKNFEYLGILIIFAGLSFVTSPKKFFVDSGVKLSFLNSVITAVLSVIVKLVSPFASASIITIAQGAQSVALFPVFAKNWKERIKVFYTKDIKGVFIATVANAASMYFQIGALRIGPAGKVIAIFQAMSIVSVIAGVIFLEERDNIWQKIIGSLVVALGVFLLV